MAKKACLTGRQARSAADALHETGIISASVAKVEMDNIMRSFAFVIDFEVFCLSSSSDKAFYAVKDITSFSTKMMKLHGTEVNISR